MKGTILFPAAISMMYLGAGIWYALAREWREAAIACLFCASNGIIFLTR